MTVLLCFSVPEIWVCTLFMSVKITLLQWASRIIFYCLCFYHANFWYLITVSTSVLRMNVFSASLPLERHNSVVIMGPMASQITGLTIVYSTVYSGADQRKHQSSASLAFVWGIHQWLVNSPHKWPVTRNMFPFDDVIIWRLLLRRPCVSSLNWSVHHRRLRLWWKISYIMLHKR